MRNLTKTLAVVSILAPASAHPLGIGDIKLHSALNQNLNAEIALVLSGEKPSDIQVGLAPPDKFNEAGVPWSYFLSKIRFQTVTRPNGSVVIKLTSTEALKEPFLDLLLEVSWPKGNLYREFTVLVDPPAVYKQPTVPVLTSPDQYQAAEQYVAPQRRSTPRRSQAAVAVEGEYGPTRRNDSLWKIAEQVRRDDDISVEQMLIALYEQNPTAFYKDNINALSAGKTLKVPEREAILKLSRRQALVELNRQTTAWKNRLATAPAAPAPVKEEVLNNQLTLNPPVEAEVSENAVVAPGNDQQVSPGNEKAAASVQPSSGGTDSNASNDAVQAKIDALEKQLAAMQQIIALKDQQLAALQNQASSKPAVETQSGSAEATVQEQPEQQVPVPSGQGKEPSSSPPLTAEPEPAVKSETETAVQEETIKPAPVEQDKPAETAVVTQEPTAPKAVEVVKPAPATAPVAQPTVQAPAETSTDLYFPIVSGVGAMMMSLLGWLWWRKRKVEEELNTESMFANVNAAKAYNAGAAVTSSALSNINAPSAENSFLSEFTTTDFDSFDIEQGEIDPISEADVYLAYGRYQQAEELIRHAINDFPGRDDCKLKLLDIFHATENKKAFETYANELAQAGKKDDPQFWAKVTELALEVCPDASLFSSAVANFDVDMGTTADVTSVNLNKAGIGGASELHRDLSDEPKQNVSATGSGQKAEFGQDDELDFDFTSFSDKDDAGSGDQSDNASLDFDLSSLTGEPSINQESEEPIALDDDRILDFDLGSLAGGNDFSVEEQSHNKSVKLAKTTNVEDGQKNGGELNTDEEFQGFDFSFDEADFKDKKSPASLDNDLEFNFDFDLSSKEKGGENQDSSIGVSDLTDMDELETKLDLARAYIDMGDADSAKDIVKEVLEKGTTEQQKIAKTLLVDLQ